MNIGIVGLGIVGSALRRYYHEQGHAVYGYDIKDETAAGLGMLSNLASAYATLGVVLLVAMGVQRALGRVPAYAAAVVWALIGMAASNWGVNPGLVVTALLGAAAMAATPFIRT